MEKVESRLSRRNMLLVAGGAFAAAGALMAAPFRNRIAAGAREVIARQPLGRAMLSLADGSFEEWQAQVGSRFAIGGAAGMTLVGVRALESRGVRPRAVSRQRAFVAVFEPIAGDTMAGDLIYTASHGEYGPLQMFLSASTDPRTPARMLAVFN